MPSKFRSINDFYHSPRWKRIRKRYKTDYCALCGKSGKDAKLILDHRIELQDVGVGHPLATDPNNLQTLCYSCHTKKTNHAKRLRAKISGRQKDLVVIPQPMEAALRRKFGNTEKT